MEASRTGFSLDTWKPPLGNRGWWMGKIPPSRFIFFTKGPWGMSHQRVSANRDCNSHIPKDYHRACRAVALARYAGGLGLEPCTYKKEAG
jgi:hypothetical protein